MLRSKSNGSIGNPDTKTAVLQIDSQEEISIINLAGELMVELSDADKVEVIYEAYEKSVLEIDKSNQFIKIECKITPRGSINNFNASKTPVCLKVILPSGFKGKLSIKNAAGKSTLNIGDYSNFTAKTGVGDMVITPKTITRGSFSANVGVGSLKVNLPTDLDANVTAKTGVGSVNSNFRFDSEERNKKFVSQSFSATTGQGSAKVSLKVGTGDISIE